MRPGRVPWPPADPAKSRSYACWMAWNLSRPPGSCRRRGRPCQHVSRQRWKPAGGSGACGAQHVETPAIGRWFMQGTCDAPCPGGAAAPAAGMPDTASQGVSTFLHVMRRQVPKDSVTEATTCTMTICHDIPASSPPPQHARPHQVQSPGWHMHPSRSFPAASVITRHASRPTAPAVWARGEWITCKLSMHGMLLPAAACCTGAACLTGQRGRQADRARPTARHVLAVQKEETVRHCHRVVLVGTAHGPRWASPGSAPRHTGCAGSSGGTTPAASTSLSCMARLSGTWRCQPNGCCTQGHAPTSIYLVSSSHATSKYVRFTSSASSG